jgi:hypothetical protein
MRAMLFWKCIGDDTEAKFSDRFAYNILCLCQNLNLERFYAYNILLNYLCINPLQTKRRPLYLKTQSVPRCKHFPTRL